MTDLSADASILKIIHTYLQPFELAVLTDAHDHKTYCNAVKYGSIEYLIIFKDICKRFNILQYVVAYSQPDITKLLISFGAADFNAGLYIAASTGQLENIKILAINATNHNSALAAAVSAGHIEAIKLIVSLGEARPSSARFFTNDSNILRLLEKLEN